MTIKQSFINGTQVRWFLVVLSSLLIALGVPISTVYATSLSLPGQVLVSKGSPEPTPFHPCVGPLSDSFISRLLGAMSKDQSRLLWSTYPASVRGQVFGGEPGRDPISSGGW